MQLLQVVVKIGDDELDWLPLEEEAARLVAAWLQDLILPAVFQAGKQFSDNPVKVFLHTR